MKTLFAADCLSSLLTGCGIVRGEVRAWQQQNDERAMQRCSQGFKDPECPQVATAKVSEEGP